MAFLAGESIRVSTRVVFVAAIKAGRDAIAKKSVVHLALLPIQVGEGVPCAGGGTLTSDDGMQKGFGVATVLGRKADQVGVFENITCRRPDPILLGIETRQGPALDDIFQCLPHESGVAKRATSR